MKFIGRDEELNIIKNELKKDKMSSFLIYGRRRIGKSELINESIKEEDAIKIIYECKQTSEKNNTESLAKLMCEALNISQLKFDSFENLLRFIFNESKSKKIILVLDEYPYLMQLIKGIDSILQSIIDEFKNKSKIKFFISGSYIDIMKKIQEYREPLFGRFDIKIFLKEMNYYDSSKFYPSFSNEDKVKLFSVFGGVPYFNRFIDESKSVEKNIIDLISSKNARLKDEISLILKGEINKINNCNEIFETIALKASKYNDIVLKTSISSQLLADSLSRLLDMELIEKISPINDKNNKRKTFYKIKDNLANFYYRYVYPNVSYQNKLNDQDFYNHFIKEDFEREFVPKKMKEISASFLILMNKKGYFMPSFYDIGKYWFDDKENKMNGEFDLVTLDFEEDLAVYEVKFKNEKITLKTINHLTQQLEKSGIHYKYLGFISKSGFDNEALEEMIRNGYFHFTLNDIFFKN